MRERFPEQFELLMQVSQRIVSILELDELVTQVTQLIQQTFKYYHVAIGLIEGGDVVYRAGAGTLWDNPAFAFKPVRLKVGSEGLSGWAAGSAQPLLIPDVRREPRYIWMEGSQTLSELTIPITVKGSVVGVLDIQSDQLNAFDQTDLVFMQSLANQTGIAIENARLYAIARHRAEQFRVLTEVGQRITSILEVQELLEQIVQVIQSTFHYYHAEIGLVEGDEIVFRAGAGVLWTAPDYQAQPARIKLGQGISGWAAAHAQPLMVRDVSREPRYLPVEGACTQSELAVPIMAKGQVTGVLDVESDQVGAFDETDLELMQSLANQAGIAIENARLYRNVRKVAALEERQHLARELHDSVTQSLYGITLYSQAASGQLAAQNYEQAGRHVEEIRETSQEALAEMRLLIYQLRPLLLDKEGLLSALQTRLSAVEERAGIKTALRGELAARLPSKIEEGLYHIAQEALNNSLKHSHARSVSVSLQQAEGRVRLQVADDGCGFDPEAARREGGMGLSDMEARAVELGGRLSITSRGGQGTRIEVEVPS